MIKRTVQTFFALYDPLVARLSHFDGLAPLALRIFLVPVFWTAGMQKFNNFDSTVDWFGNPDYGLGLPMPWVMAFLATAAELLGAIFLAAGLATRAIVIPLMLTMLVAAFSVHWDNGWQAIADPGAPFASAQVMASAEKLDRAKDILREHGNYDWLTSSGSFVILNNGIEFAITYFLMLLSLLFTGGGRYLSTDWWLARSARRLERNG